jgi:23S rRNA (uridine2552-2'-O)-methyltransferase
MARSKTSKGWLKEHFDDHYVMEAKKLGYRSRACFKLLEIQEKDRLIKPGMKVVDLGSAPGGWSQIATELVGESGRVVASDILPMDVLDGVEFIQGDFTEDEIYQKILNVLGDELSDLVISDMAPNMSGMMDVDQPRAMHLVELALDMAKGVLNSEGAFLVKVFQGEGFDQYMKDMRQTFKQVVTRKPSSSRARSREVYLLGKGLKN